MGHDIAVACNALTAAINIAVVLAGFFDLCRIQLMVVCRIVWVAVCIPRSHVVLTAEANTTAVDVDNSFTCVVGIDELVRPAEGEGLVLDGMLVLGRSGVVDNGTHRCQQAAAIDALLHPTAVDLHLGIAFHKAGTLHRRNLNRRCCGSTRGLIRIRSLLSYIDTTIAAAINVGPDGTTLHVDFGILGHRTELRTAIDAALDDGVLVGRLTDGDLGGFHLGHLRP